MSVERERALHVCDGAATFGEGEELKLDGFEAPPPNVAKGAGTTGLSNVRYATLAAFPQIIFSLSEPKNSKKS